MPLLEAGAKTYCASRNTESLEALSAEAAQKGFELNTKFLDLGDDKSIERLRDSIMSSENSFDILINNAVSRPVKDYHDPIDSFRKSMEINAVGLFNITRAFGDVMEKQKSGSIINIGSIQGMIGPDPTLYEGLDMNGFIPDYFFHKGGMVSLTRFMASYYGKGNVRCNCISPGGFRTESHPEAFIERYSSKTLLNRMAGDTDLKGIIVFLASDASKYITGTEYTC